MCVSVWSSSLYRLPRAGRRAILTSSRALTRLKHSCRWITAISIQASDRFCSYLSAGPARSSAVDMWAGRLQTPASFRPHTRRRVHFMLVVIFIRAFTQRTAFGSDEIDR